MLLGPIDNLLLRPVLIFLVLGPLEALSLLVELALVEAASLKSIGFKGAESSKLLSSGCVDLASWVVFVALADIMLEESGEIMPPVISSRGAEVRDWPRLIFLPPVRTVVELVDRASANEISGGNEESFGAEPMGAELNEIPFFDPSLAAVFFVARGGS